MSDFVTTSGLELLISREQIEQRIQQIGAEISSNFAGQSILLVGVLKGAAIFLADLARAITIDCTFDFISVSSYKDMQHSSSEVHLEKNLGHSVANKNVLLVEDILDTGITLTYLLNLLSSQQPAVIQTVALLDKPARRTQTIAADYVGFTIPDRFVVGYGMDFSERYRNLPDIYCMPSTTHDCAILKSEI